MNEQCAKQAEEDLSRLSVGELKRRLFWVGAVVPAGHLEKADLVAALKEAQVKAPSTSGNRSNSRTQDSDTKKPTASTRPGQRPGWTKSQSDEFEGCKEEHDVVKLFLLSEDELKSRAITAGATIPDGDVSKHYLVTALRNALKNPVDAKSQQAQVDSPSAPAGQTQSPPPPPPQTPPTSAPAPVVPAAPKESEAASNETAKAETLDLASLPAGELKRQLRAIGGERLLAGLAEKSELVEALRNARASQQNRDDESGANVAGAKPSSGSCAQQSPSEVVLTDEDMMKQMQELEQMQMDAKHQESEEAQNVEQQVAAGIQKQQATRAPVIDLDAAEPVSRPQRRRQPPEPVRKQARRSRDINVAAGITGREFNISDDEMADDDVVTVAPEISRAKTLEKPAVVESESVRGYPAAAHPAVQLQVAEGACDAEGDAEGVWF